VTRAMRLPHGDVHVSGGAPGGAFVKQLMKDTSHQETGPVPGLDVMPGNWPGLEVPIEQPAPSEDCSPILCQFVRAVNALANGIPGPRVSINELRREHRFRDEPSRLALLLVLVILYFGSVLLSLALLWLHTEDSSNVTYYTASGHRGATMEGNDLPGFLSSFNQLPTHVHLRVTGLLPMESDTATAAPAGTIHWQRDKYRVAFDFSLDLSRWLVRETSEGSIISGTGTQTPQALFEGMKVEELEDLQRFLQQDRNDLGTVILHKEVAWPGWEDLAINLRAQFRQCGFPGVVHVQCQGDEHVSVHKNRPWANFMHDRTTRLIAALSIFGWGIYEMYMKFRCKQLLVRSRFRVDIMHSDYWELISDKLSADGFNADGGRHLS